MQSITRDNNFQSVILGLGNILKLALEPIVTIGFILVNIKIL